MSKINKLTLSNFKFFGEAQTIDLGGKHLLLYGENGSGKSTIFWGLYTLLEASKKTEADVFKYFMHRNTSPESLVNIFAEEKQQPSGLTHYDSFVEVEDEIGNTKRLSLSDNDVCGDSNVKESRRATDFIDYKSLFKFQDFKNSEMPDLYSVFNYTVLPYLDFEVYTNSDRKEISNALDMWHIYKRGLKDLYSRTSCVDEVIETAEYADYKNNADKFTEGIKDLIEYINKSAVKILEALGYKFKFELVLTPPTSSYLLKVIVDENKDDNELGVEENVDFIEEKEIFEDLCFEEDGADSEEEEEEEEVKMIISRAYSTDANYKINFVLTEYNGVPVNIEKPQTFLNEAKMAAVAIAVRLSILEKRISSAIAPDALKVLVLDDVMISLDMSNRDKLSEYIIKNYSDKYQILLLTHDKSLFEFLSYKIKQHGKPSDWLYKEMYAGSDSSSSAEYPVIVDGDSDSFEKAKRYFTAKHYTTTAVYLRQTLEKLFSNALPDDIKRKIDERMRNKFVSLNDMWQQLKTVYTIPADVISLFEQSTLMIFNPAAHFNRLAVPIYKQELEKAIELVEKLQVLNLEPPIILINTGTQMTFKHPTANYSFEFELIEDVVQKQGVVNDPKCKIVTWQYNGIDHYCFKSGASNTAFVGMEKKMSWIRNSVSFMPLNADEDCFLDNTFVHSSTLRDNINN